MNSLRRIPRQAPQCLRQFTTTNQPSRPQGTHSSFLDALDPTKQADEAPPTPKNSPLRTLLGSTLRNNASRPDRASTVFSAPFTAAGSDSHTKAMKELQSSGGERAILQQMPRRWREGDVYAPHDLTIGEAKKWKKIMRRPEKDVFDMLGKNPLAFYKVC
jgi:small subunit ribosomal protein S18